MEFSPIEHRAVDRKIVSAGAWQMEYVARRVGGTGNGSEVESVVIAFHGFARPLEDMLMFEENWPKLAVLISVHLMCHGRSQAVVEGGADRVSISPEEWLALVDCAVQAECGSETKDRPWDLLAYSIGSRIALSLIAAKPERWGDVTLLASDGLKKTWMYAFTVQSNLGRWCWQRIDVHAGKIQTLLAWLAKARLISEHRHRFALFHLSSPEMRAMVYRGWYTHRLCWPTEHALQRAWTLHAAATGGNVHWFFGTRDRVIPAKNARAARRYLKAFQNHTFHELECGHGMLRADIVSRVSGLIAR